VPCGGTDAGDDFIGGEGKHDDVGCTGRMPRFPVAVTLDLRGVRRAAVAELGAEISYERGARRV